MADISVIFPTRNRCAFLADAARSALEQDFDADRYEILVVDNGSTDGTKEVVAGLTAQAPGRVRYFLEEQPGLHRGRHRGAREARGEFLVYADDDILAAPSWLAAVAP